MTSGEPHWTLGSDPGVLVAGYLDFFRGRAVAKVAALDAVEQRRSRLPSGWTPLELLHHLAYMERRWFVWGFLAEPVPDPVGDEVDGRWSVPESRDLDDVVTLLHDVGARTRHVLATHPLDTMAAVGGRFAADPPSLAWICFHVLQEYARHTGHLDVAVELAAGATGE